MSPLFRSVLLVLLALPVTAVADKKTIKVAAIDWCPQLCMQHGNPGYVTEIVREVFKQGPYHLQIDYFPWSRAINNVTFGSYQALLSPAKKEAPHLTYPKTEVGFQQMCFFNAKDSNWQYEGPESLAGKTIGLAVDTSIEELNDYVKAHPEQFQLMPYHERFIKQNVGKLEKKRIDTFIFTLNTTNYELRLIGKDKDVKNAGCVSKAPIYMAFTSDEKQQNDIAEVSQFFDKRMQMLTANGQIQRILDKYQIAPVFTPAITPAITPNNIPAN